MQKDSLKVFLKIASVIGFLYLFIVSVGLIGTAFKGFGKGFAEGLLATTSNPFIGLFIGILATSLVQSSSTTTSIVVGIVGSGAMTISNAIPIIMGANIGTTVTNTLVSLGHIGRREEFKRAIAGSSVHDFFNLMCVCILFPLEITFGILSKTAGWMSGAFVNFGGIEFTSPIKLITKPMIHFLQGITLKLAPSSNISNIFLLTISLAILFTSLYFIVSLIRSLVIKRTEIVFSKILGKQGILVILASLIFTAIVQSSSITTSLLVPLLAAGILNVETVFPMILGANIGTTVTAILASFATGNIAAITVAFVHFLFNVIGVCCIYPIKIFREIPIYLAKKLGNLAFKRRRYIIVFVLMVFFIIPGLLIFISRILR